MEIQEDKDIVGYQWGDDGSYIGEYAFPNNLDKEDIHLPPRTTLVKPIAIPGPGEELAWSGSAWIVRIEDVSWMDKEALEKSFVAGMITEAQYIQAAGK